MLGFFWALFPFPRHFLLMALSNFVIFAIFVALLPNSVVFVNFLSEFSRGHISEMSPVLFSALISKYLQVIMGIRAGAGNPWEMQNK